MLGADSDKQRVSREEDFKNSIGATLIKNSDDRKKQKRTMTKEIISRWYRAPEVILLDQNYN